MRLNSFQLQCFQCRNNNATSGSSSTSQGAADTNRLTGNKAGLILTGKLAVFIHHPAHNLSISIHIRCRDITFFTDNRCNFIYITARQTLQLSFRKLRRIYNNTALTTAIRQACHGTFTGHPKGKCLYLIHAYILMITYTALCGAKDCAVLATVAGKYFCSTVIHFYRNRNFQSTFGNRNNSCCTCIKLHCLNRFIQWNLGHFKNIHNQASLLSKRI